MTPRAIWKGFLKIAELTCEVRLHAAVSTSGRVAFHTLNRDTGHRVRRQFVDGETGAPAPAEDQVKGYELSEGEYAVFTPEEIAAVMPHSDKTLAVESFLACDEIDTVYFDRPYYMAPANAASEKAFAVIRDALRARQSAALARTVLFRRVRTVLIRPYDSGMIAETLNFDYEVLPAQQAFSGIPDVVITAEMLDLAKHIIRTKQDSFDPAGFDDRYDAALAELVRAKSQGRKIKPRAPAKTNVVSLLDALRESAGRGKSAVSKPASKPAVRRRAKAG